MKQQIIDLCRMKGWEYEINNELSTIFIYIKHDCLITVSYAESRAVMTDGYSVISELLHFTIEDFAKWVADYE